MSIYKLHNELDDPNFSQINKLNLSLLNPEQIKKGAVCEIFNSETYEGGEPKINGLFDPRMGCSDKNGVCVTCGNYNDICPGHFGKIELPLPVFNINTIDYVKKLLKCVCIRCSNILIDKSDPTILSELENKSNNQRFAMIYSLSTKMKTCQFNHACFKMQPTKYEKLLADKVPTNESPLEIHATISSEALQSTESNLTNKIKMSPLNCYNIFRRISDIDSEFLGFNPKYSRPEWLIITVLPIPPPQVRPAAIHDNDLRAEDDLTHLLNNIVKSTHHLKNKIDEEADKKTIDTHFGLLQYHVICLINNDVSNIPTLAQRSSRSLKGLVQRLKQKDGRIRSNLMGKRVDYSGRTVISVDPNIEIDEFGIPLKVAMTVTFPEKVTKLNIDRLNVYLDNGPNKYPGLKRIRKKEIMDDGTINYSEYSLNIRSSYSIKLEIGDTVYRHLIDGDIVLFNRQPTLHRMGMMAHRIIVLPYSTFRLNVTTTTPYNADFDGDEMNAHIPQSYGSKMELKEIAIVPTQIITPGKCKPVIGIIQDTLVGAYSLTKFDVSFSKWDLMNLFAYNDKFTIDMDKTSWTGKEVFSMILPKLSLETLNNSEEKIVIDNGLLKKGTLDAKIIGASMGGLVHMIFNIYNANKCKQFLDDCQKIITRWFENFSLSFSVGDIVSKKNVINEMNKFKLDGMVETEKIIYKMNNGIFNPDLEKKYLRLKMERDIRQSLTNIKENCRKILKASLSDMNNLNRTITSGSKGKTLNMLQISGLVGQQDIWGERIGFKFTDRTLPHFCKYNYSAESKGFVKNSFISGMDPHETFFHAMGGRIGVIDTAVKTAGVGYVSRRLVKSMEDLIVCYDLTIRNSMNTIIQFAYGDDNMNPTCLSKQRLTIIEYTDKQMLEEFYYDLSDKNNEVFVSMTAATKNAFLKNNKDSNLIDNEYKVLLEGRNNIRHNYFKYMDLMDSKFNSPIDLFRMINNICLKFKITSANLSDISPLYILEQNEKLINYFMKFIKEKDSMILIKLLIQSLLSTKMCIFKLRFSKNIYDLLIDDIKIKLLKSFIQPGELVGIIVEQSYYEELQQATLNTFHTAGTGNAISQGVERFSEIINVSKTVRSAQMTIYLKDEFNQSLEMAEYARSQLEYTKMEDIVSKSTILYNSSSSNNLINDENFEFIKVFQEFNSIINTELCDEEQLSKWIINFEFDKDKIISKNLTLNDIHLIIINNFNNKTDISCIINDDNAATLNMILRVKESENLDIDYIHFLKELEKEILSITLHGINGIEHSTINTVKSVSYNEDGSYFIKEEQILNCIGTNLENILRHDMVDEYRTITNEVLEILNLFGIEACREYLVREFNIILEQKIIYRHHALLADMMCLKGELMQIARYGINKSPEYSPFAKASFEEVVDVLIKSSIFAEDDNMKGVSANIMTGQHCKIGTNYFDVLLDEKNFFDNYKDVDIDTINKIDQKELEEEIDDLYSTIEDTTDSDFESTMKILDDHKLSKSFDENISIDIQKTAKKAAKKTKTIKVKE
tara:strand:+ start:3020 stop:7579 length:4560 start_codon:yes stop_codon:yes gene_type:complete